MIRANHASVHNRIINHPSVKPWVTMIGHDPEIPLDLSECAARPEHYVLLHNGSWLLDPDADGALVFDGIQCVGIYEMHTAFLPSCRGSKAIASANEMVRHMYEVEGAIAIWGQTSIDNIAARSFFPKLGGRSVGFGDHHLAGPVEYFRQTKDEWLAFHAK